MKKILFDYIERYSEWKLDNTGCNTETIAHYMDDINSHLETHLTYDELLELEIYVSEDEEEPRD